MKFEKLPKKILRKITSFFSSFRFISIQEKNALAEMAYYRGTVKGFFPADFTSNEQKIIQIAKPFTMTSSERMVGLLRAVNYLQANGINGSFVECGVWRGGSMMAAALQLIDLGDVGRALYLFDTFEGMSDPDEHDYQFDGKSGSSFLSLNENGIKQGAYWCIAGLEDVKQNMLLTGYPQSNIHFIKGKVEDTLPHKGTGPIALLRLDTDWYQSTLHELEVLFDDLVSGGILIIDDYGHWQGAQKAVDDFFATRKIKPLLQRMDYSGRIMIKP